MPPLRLTITRDAAAVAEAATAYLAARIERNILATTLASIEAGHYAHTEPLFALARDGGTGALSGVALRTPPRLLLVTGIGAQPDEARALLEAWLKHDPDAPGVSAEAPIARQLGRAYSALTGRPTAVEFREAMHVLTQVSDPPRPARGTLREITEADLDTLLGWDRAFLLEAGILHGDDEATIRRRVERRLAEGLQYVWCQPEQPEVPLSAVGFNPAVAGVVRIGPVYTPPEQRNRGYASAAVAAASRRLLAGGAHTCMLFTDLANPTSNKIYAEVGYHRTGDWEEIALEPVEPSTDPGAR